MSSQEEYLDNLLKDVINEKQSSDNEMSYGAHADFFNGLPAEFDEAASEGSVVSDTVMENTPVLDDSIFSSLTESVIIPEAADISLDALDPIPVREEPAVVSVTENMAGPEEAGISLDAFESIPVIEEPAVASVTENTAGPEEAGISLDAFESIPV